MKAIIHVLIFGVAIAVGLGVGLLLRQRSGPDRSSAGTRTDAGVSLESSNSEMRSVGQPLPTRVTRDDSPLATELERDLSMSQGVTNWLHWFDAIERATLADYPRLVQIAEKNAGALRLLTDRWVETNPHHLFETLVAANRNGTPFSPILDGLTRALFEHWSRTDPESLVAALSTTDYFGLRDEWRRDVAVTIVRTHAELGLRLMSEWNVMNHGPRLDAITKWAADDPRHAAEYALAHPAGYATDLTMETIGKEWGKRDPVRALEFAAKQPGDAANWLAAADVQLRNRLSAAFVETWAKHEAVSALSWAEANLAGSSLVKAVAGVMRGMADKDVNSAAQLVTQLNPSAARSEAAIAVGEKWFPYSMREASVSPEAIAWLGRLDNDSLRRTLTEVQWRWATTDPQSMAAFLLARAADVASQQPFTILARELVRKDPVGAIEWASQLRSPHATKVGSAAFAEWNNSQPQIAMNWLNDLPAADPRRELFFNSAIQSIASGHQAAERLATLPAPARTEARQVIEGMALPEERRALMLKALEP